MHQPRGHVRNGQRFFGYIPDKPRVRMARAHINSLMAHFGSQAIPEAGDLSAFRSPVLDQGLSSACIGHGSSQLNDTALRAAGIAVPWDLNGVKCNSSPYHVYGNTRVEELQSSTDPLQDTGAMPSDIIVALAKYGARGMALTPGLVNGLTPDGRNSDIWTSEDVFDQPGVAANVNVKPDQQDEEEGVANLIAGEYSISVGQSGAGGTDDQMAQVISIVKRPVGVGLFVDSAFIQWTPDQGPIDTINMQDPQGGGHWVCVDSYTTMTVGGVTQRVYSVTNSWSQAWGAGGVGLITAHALATSMSDCIAWTVRLAA